MVKKFPYQPSLPKVKPVIPSINHGYPPPKPVRSDFFKALALKEKIDATALLKEVGVEVDAVKILKLLQDEEKLQVVVKKLKMKAFL